MRRSGGGHVVAASALVAALAMTATASTTWTWARFSGRPPAEVNGVTAGVLAAPSAPVTTHPEVTGAGDGNVNLTWTANEARPVTFDVERAPAGSPSAWSTVNGAGSGQPSGTLCSGSTPGVLTCAYLDGPGNSTPAPAYGQQYVYQVLAVIGGWSKASAGTLAQSLEPSGGTDTSLSSPALDAVSASSASGVWAVGQSCTVLFWNGTSWTQQAVPTAVCPSGTTLYGVAADYGSPMVVGASGVTFVCASACTSSSPTWTALSTAAEGSPTLYAVSAFDSTDIWAAGPNCAALFFNGTSWRTLAVSGAYCPAGTALDAVTAYVGYPIFAGSGTTLFGCSSACGTAPTWRALATSGVSGTPALYGLADGTSGGGNGAWAVGASGTLLSCEHQCDTTTGVWVAQTPVTATSLRAVAAAGDSLVYAVGDNGTILSCTLSCAKTGNWASAASSTSSSLAGASVPVAGSAWAVGQGATVDVLSAGHWGTQSVGLSTLKHTTLTGANLSALSSPDGALYTGQATWPSGPLPGSCSATTPSLLLQTAPVVPSGSWTITNAWATVLLQASTTPGSGAGFALLVSGDGGSTWSSYALSSPGSGGAAAITSQSIVATVASTTALQGMELCLVGTSGSGPALTTSVDLVHVDVN
jgi:hypothetical protein